MSEDESNIAPGPRVADRPRPAQLVIEEAAPAVGRNVRLDHLGGERHAVAGLVHARAQFVIVGQVIDQDLQAADPVESFAADRQRGAEAVVQAALQPHRQQHPSLEVGGDSQRLQP